MDIETFWTAIKPNLAVLAANTCTSVSDIAFKEGEDYIKRIKTDICIWMTDLQNDKLSKDEFEWLIESSRNSLQLLELKKAGLTQVEINKFTTGVVNLIIDTAFKLIF